MNKKIYGIIGVLLGIILLVYFKSYMYKSLTILDININNYSNIVKLIIDLVIDLIMCFIIYFIYKKDFKKGRKTNNIFKSFLIMIVALISLIIIMYLFEYIIKYLCDIFKIKQVNNTFYNIFNKKMDSYLIIKIIKDYFIFPFISCSLILLSADKLCRRNDTFIFTSGLLALICSSLTLKGTLLFVIINSLSTFLLYSILAMTYKKCNSIWFSIILYGLYLATNPLILNFIGW